MKINETHYKGQNMWIIKPPNLFGGRCIKVCDNYNEIKNSIKKSFEAVQLTIKQLEEEKQSEDSEEELNKIRQSTLLIQKYVEAPLLYQKRKFDIRMWVLITHKMEVYMFK